MHLLAIYEGVIPFDDNYEICLDPDSPKNLDGGGNSTKFYISSELNPRSVDDMALEFRIPETIVPIERISTYTASEFYNSFLDTGEFPCIETPMEYGNDSAY